MLLVATHSGWGSLHHGANMPTSCPVRATDIRCSRLEPRQAEWVKTPTKALKAIGDRQPSLNGLLWAALDGACKIFVNEADIWQVSRKTGATHEDTFSCADVSKTARRVLSARARLLRLPFAWGDIASPGAAAASPGQGWQSSVSDAGKPPVRAAAP